MQNPIVRSPFFYVGDKYKLMPQLQKLFPQNINKYIEPFCGGGSSFLNTKANQYLLNDIDTNVINLHLFLNNENNSEELLNKLFKEIDYYKLSCSFKEDVIPTILKKEFPKTYFSKYNKENYTKMKNDYNKTPNELLLYLLLIYGFNHMIRFNKKGEFNLPCGNVDFNKNVVNAIHNYMTFKNQNHLQFFNMDFENFLDNIKFEENDFIFLDPPYLISSSEYNKLWNTTKEKQLYKCLDELNKKGIKFGLTNLLKHKGYTNEILLEFSKKYNTFSIDSNYISFNDNTIKKTSNEIYICNY